MLKRCKTFILNILKELEANLLEMGTLINEISIDSYTKKDDIIDFDLNDVIVECRLSMLPFKKIESNINELTSNLKISNSKIKSEKAKNLLVFDDLLEKVKGNKLVNKKYEM